MSLFVCIQIVSNGLISKCGFLGVSGSRLDSAFKSFSCLHISGEFLMTLSVDLANVASNSSVCDVI